MHCGKRARSGAPAAAYVALAATVIAGFADASRAGEPFIYEGVAVHPACIHALVMQSMDVMPVTTAVSLVGCAANERTKSKVRFENDLVSFEDDAILAGGSFAYREISQLENGIYGLAVRRLLPWDEERVSLAAVKLVERAMMQHGKLVTVKQLELMGEVWVPDMQLTSFRAVGNKVHFAAGVGPNRIERTVDFTRLGKLRR